MGHGRDGGCLFDADYEIVGQLAGAAAGAVGDRNEGWTQRLELADRLIEFFPGRGGAWREKFK